MSCITEFQSTKFSIPQYKHFLLKRKIKRRINLTDDKDIRDINTIDDVEKSYNKGGSPLSCYRRYNSPSTKPKNKSSANIVKSFIVKENQQQEQICQKHFNNINLMQRCLRKQSFVNKKPLQKWKSEKMDKGMIRNGRNSKNGKGNIKTEFQNTKLRDKLRLSKNFSMQSKKQWEGSVKTRRQIYLSRERINKNNEFVLKDNEEKERGGLDRGNEWTMQIDQPQQFECYLKNILNNN